MGKALSFAIRQKIIERRQDSQSYEQIATDLGCSISGVKKIWYAYQKKGDQVLYNNYSNCGGHSIYGSSIREQVDLIRDNQQGSAYVYSKFCQKYPKQTPPSRRTLNRWWQKDGSNRQRGRPTLSEKKDGLIKPIKPGK